AAAAPPPLRDPLRRADALRGQRRRARRRDRALRRSSEEPDRPPDRARLRDPRPAAGGPPLRRPRRHTMKVLITGISGAHARMIAERLLGLGHDIVGVDRRPWPDPPAGIRVYQADVRKRPAADVFRSEKPEVVIHMATITHFSASREERLRINL